MRTTLIEIPCETCGQTIPTRVKPENVNSAKAVCQFCYRASLFLKARSADSVRAMKAEFPSGDAWFFAYQKEGETHSPVPEPRHGKVWRVTAEQIHRPSISLSPAETAPEITRPFKLEHADFSWGEGTLTEKGEDTWFTQSDLEAVRNL